MTIKELIQSIHPADPESGKQAVLHWDSLAKPLGSLGLLESSLTRIAALTGTPDIHLDKRTLLVLCADNGVIAQGVSQSDASVTEAVAAALGSGTSTVNYMANSAGCTVLPVDVGMVCRKDLPGVLNRKIRFGTDDITLGPAMSRENCEAMILSGAELVKEQKDAGCDILLLGEMGIGNTTTSAAVACVLLNEKPETMVGRGAGLSDAGLIRKTAAIRRAIELNRPDPNDPVDILAKAGGFDLAAMCGICLGAAAYRIPLILDGVITNTAALAAVRLCGDSKDALISSHLSTEPAAALLLNALGLQPLITAGLHLGEGSGAVLALSLLDQAMAVYASGHTFGHLGIDAYTPQ